MSFFSKKAKMSKGNSSSSANEEERRNSSRKQKQEGDQSSKKVEKELRKWNIYACRRCGQEVVGKDVYPMCFVVTYPYMGIAAGRLIRVPEGGISGLTFRFGSPRRVDITNEAGVVERVMIVREIYCSNRPCINRDTGSGALLGHHCANEYDPPIDSAPQLGVGNFLYLSCLEEKTREQLITRYPDGSAYGRYRK